MNTRTRTTSGSSHGSVRRGRERTVARAAIVGVGAMLVLSIGFPVGAGECTSTGSTDTLASTSCEGTAGVTTEEDTATVSTTLSVEGETSQGPVQGGAALGVDEQETVDTPSYTSEERQVSVPGTQTPEVTVTTPRIDIREPIDVQAGGRTTVPPVTVDERSVSFGGTHYGVPDADVSIDLFDPTGGSDGEPVIRQPVARGSGSGHLVEGTNEGSATTGSAGAPGGPDGHLAPGTRDGTGHHLTAAAPAAPTSSGPARTHTGTATDGLSSLTSGSSMYGSIGRDGHAVAGALSMHPSTGSWTGSGSPGGASASAGDALAPLAAVAIGMLVLAGTGYLVVQRRSPVDLS